VVPGECELPVAGNPPDVRAARPRWRDGALPQRVHGKVPVRPHPAVALSGADPLRLAHDPDVPQRVSPNRRRIDIEPARCGGAPASRSEVMELVRVVKAPMPTDCCVMFLSESWEVIGLKVISRRREIEPFTVDCVRCLSLSVLWMGYYSFIHGFYQVWRSLCLCHSFGNLAC